MDEVVPRAEIVARIDAAMPLEALRAQLPRRGGRSLPISRWRRRSRRHRVRDRAVLRRLHPGRGCPPRASSSPACSPPGAPTCGRPLRDGRHRRRAAANDPRRLGGSRRSLLRAPHRRHRRPAAGRDVRDRRLRVSRWRSMPRLPVATLTRRLVAFFLDGFILVPVYARLRLRPQRSSSAPSSSLTPTGRVSWWSRSTRCRVALELTADAPHRRGLLRRLLGALGHDAGAAALRRRGPGGWPRAAPGAGAPVATAGSRACARPGWHRSGGRSSSFCRCVPLARRRWRPPDRGASRGSTRAGTRSCSLRRRSIHCGAGSRPDRRHGGGAGSGGAPPRADRPGAACTVPAPLTSPGAADGPARRVSPLALARCGPGTRRSAAGCPQVLHNGGKPVDAPAGRARHSWITPLSRLRRPGDDLSCPEGPRGRDHGDHINEVRRGAREQSRGLSLRVVPRSHQGAARDLGSSGRNHARSDGPASRRPCARRSASAGTRPASRCRYSLPGRFRVRGISPGCAWQLLHRPKLAGAVHHGGGPAGAQAARPCPPPSGGRVHVLPVGERVDGRRAADVVTQHHSPGVRDRVRAGPSPPGRP